MKRTILLQSLMCLLVVSCSINEMDTKDAFTISDEIFYASLESYSDADTKVYVDEKVKILWDEDDRITIFNKYTYNQEYRFLGVTGANVMTSATEDNMLRFKNVGGYLVLKFYGEGVSVSSIRLEGNNGELLSGKATVTHAMEGVPSVTMATVGREVNPVFPRIGVFTLFNNNLLKS